MHFVGLFLFSLLKMHGPKNKMGSNMFIGLHVKYPLILSDFNDTSIFLPRFRKILKFNFNENLSSGSRGVPCTRTDGQRDGQLYRWTNRDDETNSSFLVILRTHLQRTQSAVSERLKVN